MEMAKIVEYLKKYSSDKRFQKIMGAYVALFLMVMICFIICFAIDESQKESEFEPPKYQGVDVTQEERIDTYKNFSEMYKTDLLIKKLDKKILELKQQQERILKIVEGLEQIEAMNQQNLKIIEKLEKMEALKK